MDTKAAFEKFREWWFASEQMEIRLNVAEGWGFKLWLSSREAIEIDLPSGDMHLTYSGHHKLMFPGSEVVKAITSHGIRIKGKKE